MRYFESIKQDYRHDYLTSSPRKNEVLANAQIEGLTRLSKKEWESLTV